jgi:hypothetical protein
MQKYLMQQEEEKQKPAIEEAKLKQKQVAAFEKLDAALLKGNARADLSTPTPVRPASAGAGPYAPLPAPSNSAAPSAAAASSAPAAAPAGYVRVETTTGTGFIVDRASVHAQNDPNASREVQAQKASYMPSFWMPSMAPTDQGEAKLNAPPPQHCVCPGSNHTLRLKQLKPLRWCLDAEKSESSIRATSAHATTSGGIATNRPICFSCRRQLSNQVPMHANLKCGHVVSKLEEERGTLSSPFSFLSHHIRGLCSCGMQVCSACVDRVMRGRKAKANSVAAATPGAASTPPAGASTLLCAECDEPCVEQDLVQIVAATGFAATGNQVATAKLTPAFRC